MDLPPVVAFIGEIGAGKTTAAKYVANRYRYHRLPFAAPLKAMLLSLGLNDAQVNGDQKEVPSQLLCGKSPREAMQLLGTEWGRNGIGPDLWVNAWTAEVRRLHVPIVVDDARFLNEFGAIRRLGGVIIRISRDRSGRSPSEHVDHASEREQRLCTSDAIALNDKSISDLFSNVDRAVCEAVERVMRESSETTAAE